ncbi:hypothetical protein ES703_112745 [subsurface metagenome]
MAMPATTIPVSADKGLSVPWGSMATTTLVRSGCFFVLSSSIWSRCHKASGLSSRISPASSCRPSLVPSYLLRIYSRKSGARLSLFSSVCPLVTATLPLGFFSVLWSASKSLIIFIGRGVVVTTAWGLSPTLSPNIRLSQVSCGYLNLASSSTHAF